jgi:DNA polymerase-1
MESFEVERPEQVIDILGLMGDAVDNIPGVPGVGPKRAKNLIRQFGSIENVYENLESLKGKLKENLENNKQQALDSKRLATIILDAPVAFEPNKLIIEDPDKEMLGGIFSELEFRALGRRILGDEIETPKRAESANSTDTKGSFQSSLFDTGTGTAQESVKTIENTDHEYTLISSEKEIEKLVKILKSQNSFVFDTETTGVNSLDTELVGLSFSIEPHKAWYINIPESQVEAQKILEQLRPVFEDEKIEKTAHNIKFDMQVLRLYDIDVKGQLYDTMVAHYVCGTGTRHKMDRMSEAYLGYSPVPIEQLIGKKGKNQKNMRSVPIEEAKEYGAEDADITLQLKEVTKKMATEAGASSLLETLEFPLIPVLSDMEWEGIELDVPFLKSFSKDLTSELAEIQDTVFNAAEVEFNLDSPAQLGSVLFEKMKLPYKGKKTKTGRFSTDENTLSSLKNAHEIIPHILKYRELKKLKSTYVDSLPALVNQRTGRIHTTFNQTIAATGRLSSLNPNLQNIPIRTERGRTVRKAFIAKDKDHLLYSADYSQIELRIIAHITEDPGMINAFKNNEDIHSSTAAKVFGVPLDNVSADMRRKAKAVNFGLAYGQSAFGLSQTLGIPRSESKEIIENYFEQFPGIKNYMSDTIAFAKENGYVETLLGRRRYLRDINSANHTVRSQAERNAINSPIQGSAADMIKVAMINIHRVLRDEKMAARMLLQVHDELIFELPRSEQDKLAEIVTEYMKNAIPDLKVPIEVSSGFGNNWLEAH